MKNKNCFNFKRKSFLKSWILFNTEIIHSNNYLSLIMTNKVQLNDLLLKHIMTLITECSFSDLVKSLALLLVK